MASVLDDLFPPGRALPAYSPETVIQPSLYADIPIPEDPNQPNALAAGFRSGLKSAVGSIGSTLGAAGTALGSPTLETLGQAWADRLNAEAAEVGRPDLEGSLFEGGASGFLPRLGYQAAKMAPVFAAIATATRFVPPAAVPMWAARAGALAPRALGGGSLEAGTSLAKGFGGALAATYPQAVAGMYEQARQAPGGATPSDAAKALLYGLPVAAVQSVQPAGSAGLLSRGLEGKLLGRVAGAGAANAAAGLVGGGLSAAADLSFRPDIPATDKMKAIVSTALDSAALGGVLGGVFGVRRARPETLDNDALKQRTDPLLALPPPPIYAGPPREPLGLLGLPAPSDANRPPVRNPVVTPPEQTPFSAGRPALELVSERAPEGSLGEPVPPISRLIDAEEPLLRPAKVNDLRNDLFKIAGPNPARDADTFIKTLDAESLPEAYNAFSKALDIIDSGDRKKAGRLSVGMKRIGFELGVLDNTGKNRNLADDLAAVKLQRDQIYRRANDNPGLLKTKVPEINKAVAHIQELVRIRDEAKVLREAEASRLTPESDVVQKEVLDDGSLWEPVPPISRPRDVEASRLARESATNQKEAPDAVQEPSAARVDVQPAPQDGGAVAARDTQGRPITEPVARSEPTVEEKAALFEGQAFGEQPVGLGNNLSEARAQSSTDSVPKTHAEYVAEAHRNAEAAMQKFMAMGYRPEEVPARLQKYGIRLTHRTSGGITLAGRDYSTKTSPSRNRLNLEGVPPPAVDEVHPFPDRHPVSPESPSWHASVQTMLDNLASRLGMKRISVLVGNTEEKGTNGVSEKSTAEITLNKNMAKHEAVPTALHEFSHQAQTQLFENAPAHVKAAIYAAHERDRPATTFGEYSPLLSQLNARDITGRAVPDVVNSFPEWWAEQVTRWLTTNAKPVGVVEKFFKGVADLWKKVYSVAFGDKTPIAREVAEFMEGRWRSDITQAAPTGQFAEATNALAAAQGARYRLTVPGANEVISQMTNRGEALRRGLDALPWRSLKDSVRKTLLGWQQLSHLAARWGDALPSLHGVYAAQHSRDVVRRRLSQLNASVTRTITDYKAVNPKGGAALERVMQATEFQMDPRKTWAQHPHLHSEPNAAELKVQLDSFQKDWNLLAQKGGKAVYEAAEAKSRQELLSGFAVFLDSVYRGKGIEGFDVDLGDAIQSRNELHTDPQAAVQFWDNMLKSRLAGLQKYAQAQTAKSSTASPARKAVLEKELSPLSDMLARIDEKLTRMSRSPYFHLGRHGDFFVSMHIRPNKDGTGPDPRAVDTISKAFESSGFGDLSLNKASSQRHVYARVKTPEQMEALYALADQFKDQKLLDADKDVKRGPLSDGELFRDIAPKWLEKILAQVDTSDKFKIPPGATPEVRRQIGEAASAFKAEFRNLMMEMLPDNSLSKVMARRQGVQGYSTDMLRNQAFRGEVTSSALAHMLYSPKVHEALGGVRKEVRQATKDKTQDIVSLQRVADEVTRLTAGHQWVPPNSFIEHARAFTYTFYLGLSPAYAVTQLSQAPIIAWPQLAKKHGFVSSAKALFGAADKAFSVMRAVAQSPHALDAAITPATLAKTRLNAAEKAFIQNTVNRGWIDIGGFHREVADVVRGQAGGKYNKTLRMANAMAVYAETFARVQVALAAHKLHGEKPGLEAYTDQVLREGMFDFATHNTPRQMGRMGFAGAGTPLLTEFHKYQALLITKLGREFHDLVKGKTPQERAEAARFLGAHFAAAIAVSGTLGLPAAGWFAGAATRLSDLFTDGEGYDVEAHYRKFLSDVFGKGAGEIISRGLPRYVGVDLSRLGDADLAPFTQFMEDRRKFEDAFPDQAARMAGAAGSMAQNWLVGGRELIDGHVTAGMQAMLPRAFRDLAKAFQMSQEGYVDKQGRALPLSPSATDILKRALGFTPGREAEYREQADVLGDRRESMKFRSSRIRQDLARAIEKGDPDGQRSAIRRARAFDSEHPSQAILPTFEGYLRRRQQAVLEARAAGTPLGVSIKDLAGRELTSYVNYGQ